MIHLSLHFVSISCLLVFRVTRILTHWVRNKMSVIFQTTFSNAFLMKMYEFRLKFHRSLFLSIQLTISQHWFRKCVMHHWEQTRVTFESQYNTFRTRKCLQINSHLCQCATISRDYSRGPFYHHGFILILVRITNYIIVKCRVKSIFHSQTSTVQPLKFGN